MMPLFDVRQVLESLPLVELDVASGGPVTPAYRDYVSNSRHGAHWEPLNVRKRFGEVRVPTFLIGGWYDYYAGEAFANYLALRESAATAALADSHRILIGPWTHGINSTTVLGEMDFGATALAENDATMRWLECVLAGRHTSEFQQAPIRIFVMGINEWRDEHEWPLARTEYVEYYLHAEGGLSHAMPGDEPADRYTYNPAYSVPTLGGNHSIGPYNPALYEMARPGPFDQRPNEQRDDVLVFTTEPLERDLEVTGPVSVTLHASSSAPDTDFVARLTDVYPDGRSMNITEGCIRARFREDIWGQPKLMEPGMVYEFTIDLAVTSNVFLAGHRLRLQITSSNFPLWDRNLNTGEDIATGARMEIAEQAIYHDRQRSSCIRLPVIGSQNACGRSGG